MLTPHATDISGFISLAPGAYTFVVKAKTETDQGVGMIEVFEVD